MLGSDVMRAAIKKGDLDPEDLRKGLLILLGKVSAQARGINMPRLMDSPLGGPYAICSEIFLPRTRWDDKCKAMKGELASTHMFILVAVDEEVQIRISGINNRGKLMVIEASYIPGLQPRFVSAVRTAEYSHEHLMTQGRWQSDFFGENWDRDSVMVNTLLFRLEELERHRRKALAESGALLGEAQNLAELFSVNHYEQ